jgi:ribonuclease D
MAAHIEQETSQGFRWIEDQESFDQLIDSLLRADRYALDTEFHRERSYFPKLALLQLASESGEVSLVDPLRVDLSSLRTLFAAPAVAVLHAAQQDFDVLAHACGAVPGRLFDTQLAAGFLGYSTPSLVALLHGELRIAAAKGDRLTDWLRRPLTLEQQRYAASDVAHLLLLQDRLVDQLAALGRVEWVDAACEELRLRPASGTAPDDAWARLKDIRVLKPRARGVAQAVAAWRERRAMASDVPVRQVLPDLAVLGIAQKQPRTVSELAQARGVDDRHTRGAIAKEILEAVEAGAQRDAVLPVGEADDLDRNLRPAVALVSAWVGDLARRARLDPALVATRSDVVAVLRGDESARLAHGWRAELVGDDVRDLINGEAALTFDRRGGLRLVRTAGDPPDGRSGVSRRAPLSADAHDR